jgi:hypothetical protein
MDVRRVAGVRVRPRGGASHSAADLLGWVALAAVVAVLATARPFAPQAAGATPSGSPSDAQAELDQGAAAMGSASARSFDFTVVTRSTIYAKPGGPRIQVPDPADPYKVAGVADSYYLGASAARGTVAGKDFFLQMYGGDTDPAAAVDIAKLSPTLAGLVTGGTSWRNDGTGWYQSDQVPGIGLDPRTIALLPTLLKHATHAAADAPTALRGLQLPTVRADGAVADAPGLMAPDAAPFTQLAQPLSFAFDAQGRLAQVTATMRNTKVADFDLLVVTTITFDYGHVSAIPAPSPLAPPPATPAPDPAAAASQGA